MHNHFEVPRDGVRPHTCTSTEVVSSRANYHKDASLHTAKTDSAMAAWVSAVDKQNGKVEKSQTTKN